MTKETIYVTYYYEKIPSGKVIVKYAELETRKEFTYVDENGETRPYRDEQSGNVGERYTTEAREIPYYELATEVLPSNRIGVYTEDEQVVMYYYKKAPFDIGINKTVSKVTMNGEEVKIKENSNSIKVEVKDSQVESANIEVRYKIEVSNIGRIKGTADIMENIPSGFEVTRENASYWAQVGEGRLKTEVELEAGETKELEVVLRWSNSAQDLGTLVNEVELTNNTNDAGYEEEKLEDNRSSAEMLIGIRTGATWKELVLETVIILAALTATSFTISLLVLKYTKEKEIR